MAITEIASVAIASGSSGALAAAVGVPATRALSRLILGVADIGIARLERPARMIRAKTEALIEASKTAESSSPQTVGLVERANIRIANQEERHQANREAVAEVAYRMLEADPPKTEAEVSEEFMSAFERLADDASSEELQALFARILANECRTPGSYSRATIHFMNMMDSPLAQEIESWAGLISGTPKAFSIPEGPPFGKGVRLLSMKRLAGLGLFAMGAAISWREKLVWFYFDVAVSAQAPAEKRFTVAYLTLILPRFSGHPC